MHKTNSLSEQCLHKAETEGLTSYMNDTKWRELCMASSAFEEPPAWRAEDLLNGHLSDWDRDWFHHVGPDYCTIEWLEISPGNSREEIKSVLRKFGIPSVESEGNLKVIGYK